MKAAQVAASNCPFCGGGHLELDTLNSEALAAWRKLGGGGNGDFVSCSSCMAAGPISSTKRLAILRWNERGRPFQGRAKIFHLAD